jgi:hypothetical protein
MSLKLRLPVAESLQPQKHQVTESLHEGNVRARLNERLRNEEEILKVI